METNAKPFYLTEKENDQLEKWLSSLSLEQKVGQLFCVLGDLYDEEKTKELVYDKAIGGVLFRPASLGELQKRYQKLDALAEIPLFKAANLEDGADGAILEGKRYSSELGVAACNDKAFARELALSSSFEARKAGINITFSPDSDIDFNFLNPITNERTFGSSPSRVRELVREEIQGFLDNGILPTIKHFPGDGVDFRDQHLLPSVNSLSYSSWLRSYGSVYKSAILAGVPCVMVGHIAAPKVAEALDPSLTKKEAYLPASLSATLLKKMLRETLGFHGLILSDATIMGGFTQAYPREEALPRAIASGIDMLVFNADVDEDYSYLLQGVQKGLLSIERLNEAIRHILAAKLLMLRLSANKPQDVLPDSRKKLADASITLVKKGDELPLSHEKYDTVELIPLGNLSCNEGSLLSMAKERLEKEGYAVRVFSIDNVDMHGPNSLRKRTLYLYLSNLETASNQTTLRINWAKKHALDSPRYVNEAPHVFVSFSNPFHLIDVPRIKTYINAYTLNKDVVESLFDKLMGKSPFRGTSPVDPFAGLEDTKL